MKIKKTIFVIFVVLAGLAFLATTIYYAIGLNGQNEKISGLLLTLVISGLAGPMFFLPTYLNSKESYGLSTAFVNYFMMILESTTMLLGLTLYGNAIGSYGQFYILLIYAFFGFHIFSYPKKFLNSLVQLIILIGYMAWNVVGLKLWSHTTSSNFEIIYNSLFKNGFVFTWALITGGLLAFGRFWYMSLNQKKYQQALVNVDHIKTLHVPLALYTVFIFIPGVWYMSHGLENFFAPNGTVIFYLIDIAYFVYVVYTQSQNFSNQFTKFLTGKYEVAVPIDETDETRENR